jgi:hypothetical protein
MNWPICDEVLDGDTPALKSTILTAGSSFLKQSLKSTFNLPKCRCCSISLPSHNLSNSSLSLPTTFPSNDHSPGATLPKSDSYMKICNRKPNTAHIAWSLVGLVSRNLANSWQCASPQEVKGYFTWTSTAQTWTLYVVGPGSAQIEDTIMESCESLVPKVVVVPAAVVGNETKQLGNGTNGTVIMSPGALKRRLKTYVLP